MDKLKLSFTTLACPDWPLEKVIDSAAAYGYDAIDFRGLNGEMNVFKLPEFKERSDETRARIEGAGLKVTAFSSSVKAFSKAVLADSIAEVKEYARLCETFGAEFIRVFGGAIGELDRAEAIRVLGANLRELANVAAASGVKVVLETHDDWLDSRHVRAAFELASADNLGILWDVHHPYRVIGESPETTLQELGPWIRYTHVKDSIPKPGNPKHPYEYCLTGEGDIPIKRIVTLLQANGYDGYYTLEWEKKWHPEIADPAIALPQYVEYMRSL